MRKSLRIAAAALAGLALQAGAIPIAVDQIIFQNVDGGNPAALAGTVDMTLSGSTLTVVLRNTSTATGALPGSFNLLTGLGFNLPSGVTIGTGSAALTAGSTGVNWNNTTLGNNVSQEWGYDNNVASGPFKDVTTLTVNTAISSMEASSDTKFQSGQLLTPGSLNGPEFGLLSAAVSSTQAGGLYAIQDSITVTINLAGSYGGNLLNYIESHDVVLSFASPVPDGGSTMIILGIAMVGLESLRRRLGHKRTM